MRILVPGGTSFVGRAIVTDALQAGAEVTLFSRGRTGAGLGNVGRTTQRSSAAGRGGTADQASDPGTFRAVVRDDAQTIMLSRQVIRLTRHVRAGPRLRASAGV